MSIIWCSTADGSYGGCDTWDDLIVLDASFLTKNELDIVLHSDDEGAVIDTLVAANDRVKEEARA